MIRSHLRPIHVGAAVCLMLLASCGDDAATGASSEVSGSSERGAATLTVGDQTWEFDNVQCAVGSDQTNSTDWDFSMAANIGGLQLIVDRAAPDGRWGDTISLFGGENPTDPGIAWEAPAADLTGGTPIQNSFVEVDGKTVTAATTFWNDLEGTGDPVPGTLSAQCP